MAFLNRIQPLDDIHLTHGTFNYEDTKLAFNQELGFVIISNTLTYRLVHNREAIQKIVDEIKIGSTEYQVHFKEKCQVVNVNGKDILAKVLINEESCSITMNKEILPVDESFDVLAELHMLDPHLGMEAILSILSNIYIMPTLIELFWRACRGCRINKDPYVFLSYQIVAEINVFPLQRSDCSNFHHIFLYVERNTNLVFLRPLKTETPEEVAYELLMILCDFGLPNFLNCHNRLFFEDVLAVLSRLKLPFKMPILYSGCVEHKLSIMSHKALLMLNDWMRKSKSLNWSIGAHIVQWIMNSNEVNETYIRSKIVIGPLYSPYHAMFGMLPHTNTIEFMFNNNNTSLPQDNKKSKRSLNICSQCNQEVYKKYNCHYCKQVCHITCCERVIQKGEEMPIIINICPSCVHMLHHRDEDVTEVQDTCSKLI